MEWGVGEEAREFQLIPVRTSLKRGDRHGGIRLECPSLLNIF